MKTFIKQGIITGAIEKYGHLGIQKVKEYLKTQGIGISADALRARIKRMSN